MKKNYFVLLLSVLGVSASAQTITRANLPSAGETFVSTYVSSEEGEWNPGQAGDQQVWDFSTFTGDAVPFSYQSVSSNVFTNAQFKLGLDNMGDSYFAASESDYQLVGVTSSIEGFDLDVPYDNPLVMFKFPMMYQDSFKDTAYSEYTNQVTYFGQQINALTKRTTHSETTVDGRGTLKLTNKDYDDVLRVKVYASIYDTVTGPFGYNQKVKSSTEEYYFFSADYKHQLAYFMKVVTDAQPEPFQFIFTFPTPVVLSNTYGLDKNENAIVYPNPASNNVNINMEDAVSIEIYDMTGNSVLTSKLNGGLNSLNVASFRSGLYSYRIQLASGDVQTGKLNVQ